MTPSQIRAARFLMRCQYATPAEIGYAVAEDRARRPGGMKAQGAGRLGGMIARQMVELGLVEFATRKREGYPAYRISPAGRAAINKL